MPIHCLSLTEYRRFPSRVVKIGKKHIGGNNPVLLQSMTTVYTIGATIHSDD